MRRPVLFILSLGLLLVFLGCSRPSPLQHRLEQLDSLVDEHPDSVLRVLKAMPSDRFETDELRAYYALLLAMSMDKSFHPLLSDSLIRQSVAYYDEHGNYHQRALAHYYYSVFFRDTNCQPEMLHELLLADFNLSKTHDERLKSMIDYYIGQVYFNNGLYDKALPFFTNALKCAEDINDTIVYIEVVEELSAVQTYMGEIGLAKNNLRIAENLSRQIKYDQGLAISYLYLSRLYRRNGEYSQALDYARKSFFVDTEVSKHLRTYFMGLTMHLNGMNDSAKVYLNQALCHDYYIDSDCYALLADIYKEEGNLALSVKYEKLFSEYIDSLNNAKIDVSVSEVEHEYILMSNRERQLRTYIVIGVSILVCISVLVFLFLWWRKQKNIRVKWLSSEKKQIEAVLQAKECEINNITRENNLLIQKQQEAEEVLLHRKALAREQLHYSDVYSKIQRIIDSNIKYAESNESLTHQEWLHLFHLTDLAYNKVMLRLQTDYVMKAEEYRICCLLMLGLPSSHVEYVTKTPHTSFYRSVNRICQNLYLPGNVDKLRMFLKKMVES